MVKKDCFATLRLTEMTNLPFINSVPKCVQQPWLAQTKALSVSHVDMDAETTQVLKPAFPSQVF